MKKLVEYLIKNLVDNPDQVRIQESSNDSKSELHIHAAQSDRGKIIGKGGCVIKAIRTIANAAVSKQKKRTFIDLLDE